MLIAVRHWISLFHSPFDVVDDTHQGDLSELTEPRTRSHGGSERALDSGIDGLGHRALSVEIVVDSGVVGVVVGSKDPVFDQGSDAEVTQGLSKRLLVVVLVSGQCPQIARVPAGNLLAEVCIASFPGR